MSRLDYVYGAVAAKERQRWPDASLAVARRSLRHLAERYNDETIQCIVCFVCGSQEVTLDSYNVNNDKKPIAYVGKKNSRTPNIIAREPYSTIAATTCGELGISILDCTREALDQTMMQVAKYRNRNSQWNMTETNIYDWQPKGSRTLLRTNLG